MAGRPSRFVRPDRLSALSPRAGAYRPALIRVLQVVLAAGNLGAAYGHVLEMLPKRAMSGPHWLTTQQAYADFGKVAGVLLPVSTIASLVGAARSGHRRQAISFLVHALCNLLTVGIWAKVNEPVNKEIVDWNWRQRRDAWEFGHATSAGVHLIGLVALTSAVLDDNRVGPRVPRQRR